MSAKTKNGLDIDKIAQALGAEHMGTVEEMGGIPGIIAHLREANRKYCDENGCLIDAFFREEAKKPAHSRATSCLISCPCRKCNPASLKGSQ
jgi:hypothetical protein